MKLKHIIWRDLTSQLWQTFPYFILDFVMEKVLRKSTAQTGQD